MRPIKFRSYSIVALSLGVLFVLVVFGIGAFPVPTIAQIPEEIRIEHVPGEVLVKFKAGIPANEVAAIHAQIGAEVENVIPAIGVHRVRGTRGQSTAALIMAYSNLPLVVEYAEPNGIFHTQITPNDPLLSDLWGLHNIGQTIFVPRGAIPISITGTPDADIDGPEAWNLHTGSQAVVVADIDTGVYYTHPDLMPNMWTNPGEIPDNGIDDDANGFIDDVYGWDFANNDNDPMDDNGHGTHTSGTIGAAGNNGLGIVGVNWQAGIMAVKFIRGDGSGTFEDAAEAILYASQMGARISSNSWGCGGDKQCVSQVVEDALQVAYTRGMLFVAAAGNAGVNNDTNVFYPCNSTVGNVVCVAATDHLDHRAWFSNFGAETVDLGAPGLYILSTFPVESYRFLSGTSMATPHVAGAAALALAQSPSLTTDRLKAVLIGTVDPLAALDGITVSNGRLNLDTALRSNFTVSATPGTATITRPGRSTQYTVTVHSIKNYSAPITLSLEVPDSTITGSFSVNPVTPGPFESAESVLTVTGTVPGNDKLTVHATDPGGETHAITAILNVNGAQFDFSVSPVSLAVAAGGSGKTYTVTVSSIDRYNQPVALSLETDDPNITGSFSPNPVTPPRDGTITSTLTVSAGAPAEIGTHVLAVHGTDGVKTRTQYATLGVAEIEGQDLTLTMLNSGQSTASRNHGTATFYFTLYNRGTERVDDPNLSNPTPLKVGIYLSTDTILDVNTDVRVQTGFAPRLDPLESYTGIATAELLPLDPPLQEGTTYYVLALADPENAKQESDETNNSLLSGDTMRILTDVSDLVARDISGPSSAIAGTFISVTGTLLNQGPGQASSNIGPCDSKALSFFLSADPTITDSDFNLGGFYTCNDLQPGESYGKTTSLRIPGTVPAGNYYLGGFADVVNGVIETDETNNTALGNMITISNQPDISLSLVSGPFSAVRGSTITVTDSVYNNGSADTGPFVIGFYLSTDNVIDPNDTLIGSRTVTNLAPGEFNDRVNTQVLIPSNMKVGTYYLGGIADYNNAVSEISEENNAQTGNTIEILRR